MNVYVLRDTAVGDTPGNRHDTEAGGLTLAVRLGLPVLNDYFVCYDKVHYRSTFISHMRPGLLIATFDYGMHDDALGSYRLVACARDIIHFAESSTGLGMEIPWESWGPASTRIFLDVLESDQAFLWSVNSPLVCVICVIDHLSVLLHVPQAIGPLFSWLR